MSNYKAKVSTPLTTRAARNMEVDLTSSSPSDRDPTPRPRADRQGGRSLVFATNNAHKLQEVRQILGGRFEVLGLADIGCTEDIPETADTLDGNALQKARYVKEHYGLDCFADDTGLEVTALNGAPGVYTARYAELFYKDNENVTAKHLHNENATAKHLHNENASAVGGAGFSPAHFLSHDSNANMTLLLHNLENITDRSARFRTVIALIYKGEEHLFEGICTGTILRERHGSEGFGYDPVFQPSGYDRCFAEMTADEKNAISHRGRATQKLVEFLS